MATKLQYLRVVSKDAINKVAVKIENKGYGAAYEYAKAYGFPYSGADSVQIACTNKKADNDLSGHGQSLCIDVGAVGDDVGINLGGDDYNTHQIEKAHNDHLGNLIGK